MNYDYGLFFFQIRLGTRFLIVIVSSSDAND
jgi:hypothetical protein